MFWDFESQTLWNMLGTKKGVYFEKQICKFMKYLPYLSPQNKSPIKLFFLYILWKSPLYHLTPSKEYIMGYIGKFQSVSQHICKILGLNFNEDLWNIIMTLAQYRLLMVPITHNPVTLSSSFVALLKSQISNSLEHSH